MKMHILKERVTTTEQEREYWEESTLVTLKIEDAPVLRGRKGRALRKEVKEYLAHFFPIDYRCDHEHDCCGCMHSNVFEIKRVKRSEFHVKLHHYRNY